MSIIDLNKNLSLSFSDIHKRYNTNIATVSKTKQEAPLKLSLKNKILIVFAISIILIVLTFLFFIFFKIVDPKPVQQEVKVVIPKAPPPQPKISLSSYSLIGTLDFEIETITPAMQTTQTVNTLNDNFDFILNNATPKDLYALETYSNKYNIALSYKPLYNFVWNVYIKDANGDLVINKEKVSLIKSFNSKKSALEFALSTNFQTIIMLTEDTSINYDIKGCCADLNTLTLFFNDSKIPQTRFILEKQKE